MPARYAILPIFAIFAYYHMASLLSLRLRLFAATFFAAIIFALRSLPFSWKP